VRIGHQKEGVMAVANKPQQQKSVTILGTDWRYHFQTEQQTPLAKPIFFVEPKFT
jgi:hypothetical protein